MTLFTIIIECVLAGTGSVALWLFSQAVNEIKKLRDGVESLNIKMAVICEQVSTHERRITSLEV